MDASELKAGITKCRENAEDLVKAAKQIVKKRKYGPACSLLVLSCEESVKACALVSIYLGTESQFPIEKYFRVHQKKHITGKEIEGLIRPFDGLEQFLAICKGGLPAALKFVLNFFVTKPPSKWWKGADDLKKQGLYVDLVSEGWRTPSEVSPETYRDSLHQAEFLIKWVGKAENILNPENHQLAKKIEKSHFEQPD